MPNTFVTLVTLAVLALRFFAASRFFGSLAPVKRKTPVRLAVGASFCLLCFLQTFFYRQPVVSVAVFFVLIALYFLLCHETSLRRALIAPAFVCLISVLSEAAVGLVFPALGFDLSEDDLLFLSFSQAMGLLLYFVLLLSVASVFKRRSASDGRGVPAYFFLYPVVSGVCVVLLWELCEMVELSVFTAHLTVVTVFLVLASVLLTYVFYEKAAKKELLLRSLEDETRTARINREYNSVLTAQNETLKELIHDEKNHLNAIAAMTDDERIRAYISSVGGELTASSFFGSTDNKLLDLLIGKYRVLCDERGVSFTVNIKTSNLSFMSEPDLTCLVCNILDNALGAAAASPEKTVELSINKINGFNVLTCRNSCEREPRSRGGELLSSKTSPGCHGNGMRIIRRVAAKYNGKLDWEYHEKTKEFSLSILL